jgi:hypothetical protein
LRIAAAASFAALSSGVPGAARTAAGPLLGAGALSVRGIA